MDFTFLYGISVLGRICDISNTYIPTFLMKIHSIVTL